MKKLFGILAVALFVVLASTSCKTKANCDAYNGMADQTQSEKTDH
nr:hypothetical protein [uncultured Fluviicola sp.]